MAFRPATAHNRLLLVSRRLVAQPRSAITEAAMAKKSPKKPKAPPTTETYEHPEATVALRPDVGTQAQFKKQKPNERYRYDSSLSPALEWDGQNSAREQGEALLAEILEAANLAPGDLAPGDSPGAKLARIRAAAMQLKALGKPFLNWAGKAERLSFDVPT